MVAVAYPANVASHRVLVKAGLHNIGRRHAFGQDLEHFILDRAEWTAEQSPDPTSPPPGTRRQAPGVWRLAPDA